jgi:formate-dependent nitrite reductase membrane component NrfD
MNKFDSFSEYFRQVMGVTKEGRFTKDTAVFFGALAVLIISLLMRHFSLHKPALFQDPASSALGALIFIVVSGVITLLLFLVPLFHSEYGRGK